MNTCRLCVYRIRYVDAVTHWCRRTGIHIEGQVAKSPNDGWVNLPHDPSPAWCPGMKEYDDER